MLRSGGETRAPRGGSIQDRLSQPVVACGIGGNLKLRMLRQPRTMQLSHVREHRATLGTPLHVRGQLLPVVGVDLAGSGERTKLLKSFVL